VEPTRLQKERKAKEQPAEKHINRSWEKELEGLRPIARGRRKWKELVDNLCSFLTDCWTLLLLLLLVVVVLVLFIASVPY
jgi:hypothetical protein